MCTKTKTSGYHRLSHSSGAPLPTSDLRDQLQATLSGSLGVIAAQRGDTTRAHAVADSLGRQTRKWDFGLSPWWRAAILAHLGRRDEAMQFLGEARRQGQGMINWHSKTALRPLRGYPPFEAMITPEK